MDGIGDSLESAAASVWSGVKETASAAVDSISAILALPGKLSDAVSGAADGVASWTKWIPWLILALIVVVGFFLVKNPAILGGLF